MTTISARASAAVRPKPARITCPCCDHSWDLNGKPRSLDQHRRFFGIVRAAFAHWPESHERQFSDERELRGWLVMKAGPEWRQTVLNMPMQGVKPEVAAMVAGAAIRAVGRSAVALAHKGGLIVMAPKSIKFSTMKHMEFVALNDAVESVIKDVFGMSGDELLEKAKGNV
jgi:hypothetical protein